MNLQIFIFKVIAQKFYKSIVVNTFVRLFH